MKFIHGIPFCTGEFDMCGINTNDWYLFSGKLVCPECDSFALSEQNVLLSEKISEEVKKGLQHYVGRPVTPVLLETIRAHLMILLKKYQGLGIIKKIPDVRLNQSPTTQEVSASFVDTDTQEAVNFIDLIEPQRKQDDEGRH